LKLIVKISEPVALDELASAGQPDYNEMWKRGAGQANDQTRQTQAALLGKSHE